MSFQVLNALPEWKAYMAQVSDNLGMGKSLVSEPIGPQQYPCLVSYMLIETPSKPDAPDIELADAIYAFVYMSDCVTLMEAHDSETLHNNLISAGMIEAEEAVQKGYKDGDGPSRWISTKLQGDLLQFLTELRTIIPAFSKTPEEQERGIDCVIMLENFVKHFTREGHLAVEESDLMKHVDVLSAETRRHVTVPQDLESFDLLTEHVKAGVRLLFNIPEPGTQSSGKYAEDGPAVEDWRQWVSAALMTIGANNCGTEEFSKRLQQNISLIEQDHAAKREELLNENL